MPAATYNITIEQGATFSKTLTFKDSQDNVMDLTDVVALRAQLRPRVQFEEKWDFTVEVINPSQGTVRWTMSPGVTKTIDKGKGVYDLEIEWNDGRIERLLEGTALIKQNITRED